MDAALKIIKFCIVLMIRYTTKMHILVYENIHTMITIIIKTLHYARKTTIYKPHNNLK